MNLSDSALSRHRILLSVVLIALCITLTMMGFDSTITLVQGAACGYLVSVFQLKTGVLLPKDDEKKINVI